VSQGSGLRPERLTGALATAWAIQSEFACNLLEAQLADMRPAVSTGYARGRFDPPPIERRKLM
jgi:hypothetical protein